MDPVIALKNMWSLCDKPERLRTFHKIVFEIGITDAEQFWTNFWSIWTSSENLFDDGDLYTALIEHGMALGDPKLGLDEDEREIIAAMPEMVTVYRGCLDVNQDGWSWTTDRATAKWFAERAYNGDDTERFVLVAKAPRSKIIGYHSGRNESEVVIDPNDLVDFDVDEVFYAPSTMSGLAFMVQTGRFDGFAGEEMDKVRAEMAASTVHAPYDTHIAKLGEVVQFLEWAGAKSRIGYFKALRDILTERRDNPETKVPVADHYPL